MQTAGGAVHWNERRPNEGGRLVVVRRRPDGSIEDLVPEGMSARTLVHEYGGRSYCLCGDGIVFTNFDDQRLWRVSPGGEAAAALTAAPPSPRSWRYADQVCSPDEQWIVAVRERHEGDVVNDVVAVPATGGEPVVLAAGHDFYGAPRLSPDGGQLAWISWDQPDMSWDATELWVADVSPAMQVGAARKVAGGPGESVIRPRWSPDGQLHYISDRTGWWNLYADDGGTGRALAPMDAEFAGPEWVFGGSSYAFLDDGRLVCAWSAGGRSRLGIIDGGALREVDQPSTTLSSVETDGGVAVLIGGSGTEPPAVVRIDIATGSRETLKRSREVNFDPAFVSVARPIEFPTEGGLTAHAYFYEPKNPDAAGPGGERPPLVVMSHGGPTSAAQSVHNPAIQFWTTRGIAVVDVDYGGSTGYGRAYRERLKGQWGVVDVDDCVNAARWLAEQGLVDGDRMVIRGGSAGGYTTLCALAYRDVFAAGGSLFGVADAEALATDTHKFEARYLDGLIGPYPEAADRYRERSPIHHTDGFSCPLIVFQGLEDRVVPPEQSEMIVKALQAKGIAVAYLPYEGEQHGFRKAENIIRTAEAELYFYGRVLGFTPADTIDPVDIDNEDTLNPAAT